MEDYKNMFKEFFEKTILTKKEVPNDIQNTYLIEWLQNVSPKDITHLCEGFDRIENVIFKVCKKYEKQMDTISLLLLVFCKVFLEIPDEITIHLFGEYCEMSISEKEKVAIHWADANLNNLQEVYDFEENFFKYINIIKKVYKSKKNFRPIEIAFISKYIKERIDLEVFALAHIVTFASIGEYNLKYCDKVLESWSNLGCETILDIVDGGHVGSFSRTEIKIMTLKAGKFVRDI